MKNRHRREGPRWGPLFTLLLALVLSLGASVASADEFDALVVEAAQSYEAGDYVAAVELFEAAYALDPTASNLLYNMGIASEKRGDMQAAVAYYTRFIAAPGVDHENRKDAIERIKTLKEVIALTGGAAPTQPTSPASPTTPVAAQPQQQGINLNTATQAQLETLSGIGAVKARAIIDDRVANGPYSSVQDLTRVHGIGDGTVRKIRQDTYAGPVDGAAPSMHLPTASSEPAQARQTAPRAEPQVDFNSADQASLEQIPGIGPVKAQAIIDERTQNGPFASCDDLTRVRGIGPATARKLKPHCTLSTP